MHEVTKMVWSKNTSEILFKIMSAFSINFSISTFNMPEDMITIKDYLKVNLICYMYMHLPCQEHYLQDEIREFFWVFCFYLTNTSLLCSWSVFNSTFFQVIYQFYSWLIFFTSLKPALRAIFIHRLRCALDEPLLCVLLILKVSLVNFLNLA